MSLRVLKPGLQTSVQAGRRTGYRHMGMPWAGPADALSMALANRLVSAPSDAPALEITLGNLSVRFEAEATFALTGAPAPAHLDGEDINLHRTCHAAPGSVLDLCVPATGMRTYLAVQGGFTIEAVLGSQSTYLPAGLGGFEGRALKADDRLNWPQPSCELKPLETPQALQLPITNAFALRASPGPEFDQLAEESCARLFSAPFKAASQIDRMGIALDGSPLSTVSDGKMKSAPVFPGAIQCPENGHPVILLADAQTTGGYPRIAQIARCDQHLLGQVRPHSAIHLIHRDFAEARADYAEKSALLADWLPDFRL